METEKEYVRVERRFTLSVRANSGSVYLLVPKHNNDSLGLQPGDEVEVIFTRIVAKAKVGKA